MKLNENIALAKSILNKLGITPESNEWKDYLKIREICNTNHGYVGILTRIRFQDGIQDMDEIKSIFDILKSSKIDVGKLNKMSYSDILNQFYDELKPSESDYEVVFKDNEYTFYKVNTYKGILKIGSPSWCLKTKSKWDEYQSIYPSQYVVVNNRYKNRLSVPDDDILNNYNSKKGWVRYGISINRKDDETVTWTACDDNNNNCVFDPSSWTFFGVMCTLLNILKGEKKSYYEEFYGCQKVEGTKTWQKIVDKESTLTRLKMPIDYFDGDDVELYMTLSESYSNFPVILALDKTQPRAFYPVRKNDVEYSHLTGSVSKRIFEDYAKRSNVQLYTGIKLKLGVITLDEIKLKYDLVKQIDNWLVFNRNSEYYIAVNSKPEDYYLPTLTLSNNAFDIEKEPICFYLRKSDLKPISFLVKELPIHPYHKKVIDGLKEVPKIEAPKVVEIEEPKKKVKGFWDFLKKD